MSLAEMLADPRTYVNPAVVEEQLSQEFAPQTASLLVSLAKQIDYVLNTGMLGTVLPTEIMLAVAVVFASARRFCVTGIEVPQADVRERATETLRLMDQIVRLVDAPEPPKANDDTDVSDILDELNG